MKILVLMPLDEKSVYMSAGIYKYLSDEAKNITFTMPMFMEYAITTKTSKDWVEAFYDAILGAKSVYKTADKTNKDLIIIGNMPIDYKFDAVFNFQDPEEDLPYEDKFAQKILELVKKDKMLTELATLHQGEESTFTLHNCRASADFLSAYVQTDPHLDEIKAQYADTLEFKDE